jgi:hypothetical protein
MTRLGMTVVALTIFPAVVAAQTDSSRMRGADSTRARSRQQTSSGSLYRSSNRGQRLSRAQVGQLQSALQQANCDPGTIDSVMGPHTRSAMSCARRQNNITGNNPNDLYRALNLNFANSDTASGVGNMGSRSSTGANRTTRSRSSNGATGTTGTGRPGTSGARGSSRSRADSSGTRSTRGDSTRRPSTRRDTTRPGA